MNVTVRIILACLAGIVAGSAVNMAIVTIGPMVVPPPPGVDVSDAEALARGIHLFEPRHFVAPFLAHALGTLIGAFVAFWVVPARGPLAAFVVGGFFFVGGVAASSMIPAPGWFIALDLLGAYLPMAYLGAVLGRRALGGGDASGAATD